MQNTVVCRAWTSISIQLRQARHRHSEQLATASATCDVKGRASLLRVVIQEAWTSVASYTSRDAFCVRQISRAMYQLAVYGPKTSLLMRKIQLHTNHDAKLSQLLAASGQSQAALTKVRCMAVGPPFHEDGHLFRSRCIDGIDCVGAVVF